MQPHDKTPDHHIAFGAATEGWAAATASLAVVGRYWWNIQMRLLIATGVMRFFKSQWWLFIVVGVALLAFALPVGVAFIVSAFCAGEMNPKAENDYLVPLKSEHEAASADDPTKQPGDYGGPDLPDVLEDVQSAASLHHMGYLRAIGRDMDDTEFAAAALGAFDGTAKAYGLRLSDLDMHANGAAFILAQLTNLERIDFDSADPDRIAEVTGEAMTSSALEAVRAEAGRFAYMAEGSMRFGRSQPKG